MAVPPPQPPGSGSELPLVSAAAPVLLPADPARAVASLEQALASDGGEAALRPVAARWPAFVDAWAHLGEAAYRAGHDVEAYAYFRTGYHRGLDRLRQHGWRGAGFVPWSHAPNRGVLRAFRGLMLASAALGERDEAERCRQLLLESDPTDPFDVEALGPDDFRTRLPLAEPAGRSLDPG